jgi:HEAT repeat protein
MVITALAKLGFEMQEHGRVTVDLGEMRGWQILTAGRQLEEVLAQAKDWRFLKSDGRLGEPVEFLHQLFLEYFAAEYLRRKLKDQPDYPRILGKRLFTGTWDEVIIMLAGISDRSAEMVKWLAAQMVEKKQWHAALLIQGCWETSDAARDLEARAAVIDGLIAALGDPDAHVDWSVTRALVRIGVPAVERLIATLRDPHGYVRNRALDALVQIGPPAVEPLIDALRDPNPNMRKRAAGALGQIRDPRACASLIVALRDADVVVRRRAAYALWEISCAQGVEPLIAVLHDTDAIVRQRAAYALGQLRDPRAVKPLISNLRDADKDVRACTVDALGRIGDPRAVEALIAALHDSEPEVRWSAADALGRISDPRALAELERVAQEDKGHRKYRGRVADAARKAAEKIQRRKGNK